MKKIILSLFSIFLSLGLLAQVLETLPMDPAVKYGKLENGLTYYIQANKTTDDRAEFYIAQNVGSMQEEDSQSGLAHFLEHMAFNGTKNFPKKTMLDYLEKNGIKFGVNINAYTAFDRTVYNLSDIPVSNKELVDKCLLVLYDWACGIDLVDEEIDSERGIIREEWRTGGGADMRMLEKQLPVLFKDSKYAKRLPIGDINIVNTFKYQEIKDYYKKWYHPDLQAIIVVGDFDANEMEAKVKEIFSKIPKAVNPAKKEFYPVPNNTEPLISIVTDVESTSTRLSIYHKHDILPDNIKNSVQGIYLSHVQHLIGAMLNERLSEFSEKPETPFTAAGAWYGEYYHVQAKDAFTAVAICKENQVFPSLKLLQTELERADRFGFTGAELERAKMNILKMIENAYNNRDKRRNNALVSSFVDHFTKGEPMPGLEYEFNIAKQISPMITLEVVNKLFKEMLKDDNMVVTITGPEKEGVKYPSEAEIMETIKAVKNEKLEGYAEEVVETNLIPVMPKAGTVVKKETDKTFGVSVWTLSNGIKVILKPTEFKNDEILMRGMSEGGTSLFGDSDILYSKFVNMVYSVGGVGNFSTTNLAKALAGKTVRVSPYIEELRQEITGSAAVNDVETLMQLTYLTLTTPRKDVESFKAYTERLKSVFKNRDAEPSTAFNDSLILALYGNNPHMKPVKYADVEKLNAAAYDRMFEMYKQSFANNGNLTFVFVGNIDEAKIEPYINTYLASLPKGKSVTKGKYNSVYAKGSSNTVFARTMETPKATVFNSYTGLIEYKQENTITMGYLAQILRLLYTEKIREEEGGTYGVSVNDNVSKDLKGQTRLSISFDTDPERYDHLNKMIIDIFKDVAANGVRDEDYAKVKEYLLKAHNEKLKENAYWQAILSGYFFDKFDHYTNYVKVVNGITKADIKTMAEKIVKEFDFKTVIMTSPIADK